MWIIDPIDGTMNFVMERENFCIMLAVYEDGIGKLGFIYDVMREELYWGGKGLGVYRNNQLLKAPTMKALADGLWGMNAYMHGKIFITQRKSDKQVWACVLAVVQVWKLLPC